MGHSVVWYKFTNILEKCDTSIFMTVINQATNIYTVQFAPVASVRVPVPIFSLLIFKPLFPMLNSSSTLKMETSRTSEISIN
jgi:hypothetical protein